MIDYEKPCYSGCGIKQILSINEFTFNDISNLHIYYDCENEYDLENLQFSYSLDLSCWSCYVDYDSFLELIADLSTDFYLKIKIPGPLYSVVIDGEQWKSISTQLDSTLSLTSSTTNSNLYNPYINMECAMSLYQQMTDMVSDVTGVGCYYFKLSPAAKSKDIVFKEYALMNVDSVKQIKIIITDNTMPSSKPEFSDFGIDWQTDWEVEVSKQVFATAFGVTAKPMEGDLIYIPLMKRMWMLSGAYEEKKDAFMWNATTFKLTLVKYQEKDSVDLGDTEALVNTLVKNKYEDLFGDQESLGSGFDEANNETQYMGKLYNVYEQDAVRKSLAVSSLNINSNTLYFKGNIICDSEYIFDGLEKCHEIEYQQKFCGENGTLSFIINSKSHKFESELISIGNLRLIITQSKSNTVLKCLNTNKSLELENDNSYLIYLRWSKQLNIIELASAIYTYNKTVPVYKLQPANYWFDIDNKVSVVEKYNREINVPNKSSVIIWNFNGTITNIKLFDEYISDEKEILQMYPTNNHLLINDTARKITALGGSNIS